MAVAGAAGPRGLVPTTDRFGVALADIARCGDCGHMQLEPMPAQPMLVDAYAEAAGEDYLSEQAGQRATARATLELIERHAPRAPRALLDVGCWTGTLLSEAQAGGWEVVGVEPSAHAARIARERSGLPVLQADLFSARIETGAFTAVTLGDVLEHLSDPRAALERIAELLAPGGVLWLALPDAGSAPARMLGRRWWSVIPTHVQYFTRGSIAVLLERCGWRVIELDTAPKTFSVEYYLGRLGGYSPPLARALVALARRAGLAERLWAPDFHDRMQVLARRRL
jgi:SAM-dependent methyltransferase